MKRLSGVDDLLDHFTQLINLDRENAAVIAAVLEFGNRVVKSAVDRFDAMPEQILKADDEREG